MEKRCFLFSIPVVLFMVLFSGCVSRRAVDEAILDYQRKIDRLESTIEQYDTALGAAAEELGRVKDRSIGLEGDIDEVIRLFDDYQRGVTRLIQDYYRIRHEAQDVLKGTDSVNLDTDNNDNR